MKRARRIANEASVTMRGGSISLRQLCVFHFGLDEDGNVGVGIFPRGEEILISRASFGVIALQRIRPREIQLCQRQEYIQAVQPAVIQDFLELSGRLGAIAQLQIRKPPAVYGEISCGPQRSA